MGSPRILKDRTAKRVRKLGSQPSFDSQYKHLDENSTYLLNHRFLYFTMLLKFIPRRGMREP
jgi:hypothetical protein